MTCNGELRFICNARPALWSLSFATCFVDEQGTLYWTTNRLSHFLRYRLLPFGSSISPPVGTRRLPVHEIKDCKLTYSGLLGSRVGLTIWYDDDRGEGRMTLLPIESPLSWMTRLRLASAAWSPPLPAKLILREQARFYLNIVPLLGLALALFVGFYLLGLQNISANAERVIGAVLIGGSILAYYGFVAFSVLRTQAQRNPKVPEFDPSDFG